MLSLFNVLEIWKLDIWMLYFDNNDNKMTFFPNIVYLLPCTRAQLNNNRRKSHFIPLFLSGLEKGINIPRAHGTSHKL